MEAAYRGWLSSTNLGDGGVWEDQEEDGETKNSLSFKGTGLRTLTSITFMIMMMMMMNEIFYRNESLKKHLTEIFV
jgi:hypothetical protein